MFPVPINNLFFSMSFNSQKINILLADDDNEDRELFAEALQESGLDYNLKTFENEQFESTKLYPDVTENAMSTAFSHIFAGGYSSGYYSYKWAEVLDADAFSLFKEKGIFNTETANSFRKNVLSKGGTEHPMTLYKRFRGKEPSIDALLKRNGIITKGEQP